MPTEKQRIAVAITALAESFRQTTSDAMLLGYQWGLADIPAAEVEQACAKALQRCKFMPVPAELRELCASGGASFDSMAEFAWKQFTDAVRSLGPDKSVNFHDGLINATVRLLGGWQRCCDLPRDEFDKWLRKDFLASYVRLCRDGCSEDMRKYHAGNYEIENAQWTGQPLPSGKGTYELGMFGSEVVGIDARDYQPLLPAPEPRQRLEGPGTFGGVNRIAKQ